MVTVAYGRKFHQALGGWNAIPRTRRELIQSVRMLATLRAAGWHRGLRDEVRMGPTTAEPMLTYGAIDFLEFFLHSNSRVLEFGSGGSTIWLASKAGLVISIEDDENWARKLPSLNNVELRVVPCLGDWYNDSPDFHYSKAAADDPKFDAIIIDGKSRIDCTREALSLVNASGIIVLDDLHDPFMAPAITILQDSGMKVIEFWGLRPGSGEFGGTAVFINNRQP